MIKTFALIVSIVIAASAPAQGTSVKPTLVSISSKGQDVRPVLHDMFKQAGKSFVLEPNVRFYLYLSLENIEFEEALSLVCKMASLKVEVQNGIYFINKIAPLAPPVKPTIVKAAFETKPQPKGELPRSVLNKKITTRVDKIDFRLLLANITQQTGVQFEIAPEVPNFKLDAYLIGTSLKFGLDTICRAAKLEYSFTDNLTIAITKPEPKNRVAVVGGS